MIERSHAWANLKDPYVWYVRGVGDGRVARHKDIAPEPVKPPVNEFEPDSDEGDDSAIRTRATCG
jgi:hypothetical protein